METRLTFNETLKRLSGKFVSPDDLSPYFELDTESPLPKIKFRRDALLDIPPSDFDIDKHIQTLIQEIDEEEYESEEAFRTIGKKKVVAEGDSWMNLPWILGWKSIGDSLKARNNYKVRNIGKWGDTIEEMVSKKEYMDVIHDKKPDFFVFSGGGNDLQDKLKVGGVIKAYDPDLSTSDYVTPDGMDAIEKIKEQFRELLEEVNSTFPNVKIFTHSYDYPRPLLKEGKYLGSFLRDRNIPDELMSPILNDVIHRLDTAIKEVVGRYESAHHVNCLGATKNFLWRNDFHPKNDGFDKLASLFEVEMGKNLSLAQGSDLSNNRT